MQRTLLLAALICLALLVPAQAWAGPPDAPPDGDLFGEDYVAPPDQPPAEPQVDIDAVELDAATADDDSCDGIEDPADSLYLVKQALNLLRAGDFEVVACRQVESRFRGRFIEAQVEGNQFEYLHYALERLATDGYWIEMNAIAADQVALMVRPSRTGERGLRYVGIESLELNGTFLAEDSAERLGKVLGLKARNFFPADLAGRLRALGYRASFAPVSAGAVRIGVEPGRTIRRVRVRGNTPLSEQEIQRELSIEARPGALARGNCVNPRELRDPDTRPPICDARDIACRAWEETEIERLETFLSDEGYLAGTVTLGLSCGRAADEADLMVFLNKGRSYKVSRKQTKVRGVPNQDVRWIRRAYMPRSLLIFRRPLTRDFMDESSDGVERLYAEPSRYGRVLRSASTTRPFPTVKVETNYDALVEGPPPKNRNLSLDISVDLGRAVEATFTPARRDGKRPRTLRFADRELSRQLQLFARREPPSQRLADRESANLRAFYQSRGFLLAAVGGAHEDFGSVSRLRFEIFEGPRVTMRSVRLARPDGVPPAVLTGIDRQWRLDRELRKGGRFSEADARGDMGAILTAYADAGYLCASVIARIGFFEDGLETKGQHAVLSPLSLLEATNQPTWVRQFDAQGLAAIERLDRADLHVRFEVVPGPRVVSANTEEIRYLDEPISPSRRVLDAPANASGAWGSRRIMADTPLRRKGFDVGGGLPIGLETAREAARTIVKNYRASGYPIADAEVTWRYEPTVARPQAPEVDVLDGRNLANPEVGLCQEPAGAVAVKPVVHVYEGKRGKFGDTLFRGNFKTRDWVLRSELEYEEGEDYSQNDVDKTVGGLEASGVARTVQVVRYPVGCESTEEGECTVHQVLAIEESKDYTMDVSYGAGIATLNPFYVFLRPSLPNLFGTGIDLELDGLYGFDLSDLLDETDICAGQNCFERSARGSLSRPHLAGSNVNLDITGQYQRRETPARGRIITAFGQLRFTWALPSGLTLYSGYLFQSANITEDVVKPLSGSSGAWTNRGEAIVSDRTGLVEAGAAFSRIDNAFNPHDGFIAALDLRLASPLLGGEDWWFRGDITWQHFIPIPRTQDRLDFRYSLRYGHAIPFSGFLAETTAIPEVWRYYGGGTQDLGLRGILAETWLVDVEQIDLPYGGALSRPRAEGAHIRAIGSVALQVVSFKDFLGGQLAHSWFYDFGVLAQRWRYVDLARDYRHSVGVNFLKWDVRVVTLALGYAILLPPNVRVTDDRNGRFVFDVGVTF